MSVRMMTLVWELQLADSEKLVLLALADWANDEGLCWPSIDTLAKKCSKSERTIQACIRSLCSKGHLTQKRGTHKTPDYIVHPIVRFADPRSGCTPQSLHPAAAAPDPRSPCTPTPAAAAPNTSKKPKEPSKGRAAYPPPPGVSDDSWSDYLKLRERKKAPMSATAYKRLCSKLAELEAHDPNEIVATSVERGWTGFFEPRGDAKPAKQYVSASGYVYRGDPDQVQREARRRGDNDTYWQVEVDRKSGAQSIGEIARRVANA
jgi:hypothetical protein